MSDVRLISKFILIAPSDVCSFELNLSYITLVVGIFKTNIVL